ncbi:MAG: cytochrome c biogenesis protein CcdA [Vicinamibacterales bacterium]
MVAMRMPAAAGVAALTLALAAPAAAQSPVRWTLSVDAGTDVRPGVSFEATLAARVDAGWHLYALTQPPGGPQALVIAVPADAAFALGERVIGPLPFIDFDPNFGIDTQYHTDAAEFFVPLVARPASGDAEIALDVTFQTCTDRYCLPPATEHLRLPVSVGGPLAEAVSTSRGGGTGAGSDAPPATGAGSDAPPAMGRAVVPDLAADTGAGTLGAYVGLAALMGALSLFTPCVFPMVPITVSFFSSRAERRRGRAAAQAAVYGLGIVLSFTAVGAVVATAFGASGINQFAANPWLNIGIALLFTGFALNLFGAFELALPSGLLTRVAAAEAGRPRFLATLVMGLAFTLTSFTCTAPFLGTLLVVAAQGDWVWPMAGLLAFSTVFAVPFVLLAFAPQVLASLPRSGPWLLSIKTAMGLLEIAAAMKFLSNADLVWGWGVFTRDVVIGVWMATGLVLAAYLAGVLRFGRSGPLGRPGVVRLAGLAGVLVLVGWLGFGLRGHRLGELEAFLPPADPGVGAAAGELAWIVNDYDGARSRSASQGLPLLIDFTGYTCTNCRWMEANMFPRPEVARELDRYVRVRLYTDGRGPEFLAFQQMQRDVFGTVALPYYAVIGPDGRPRVAFGGLTRDSARFVGFLRRGRDGGP